MIQLAKTQCVVDMCVRQRTERETVYRVEQVSGSWFPLQTPLIKTLEF